MEKCYREHCWFKKILLVWRLYLHTKGTNIYLCLPYSTVILLDWELFSLWTSLYYYVDKNEQILKQPVPLSHMPKYSKNKVFHCTDHFDSKYLQFWATFTNP